MDVKKAFVLSLLLHLLGCASCLDRSDFPSSFLWGTSTSAFQIEGSYLSDNKSLSNWDVFSHIQGKINDGSNADVADDHYNRYMVKQQGYVGIVVAANWYEPYTNSALDRSAVERVLSFEVEWFLDPIMHGEYPKEMRQVLGSRLPQFSYEDRRKLYHKLDFIGVNHYFSLYAKDCLFSQCPPGGYDMHAYVFSTGESNGILIGPQTTMPGFYVFPSGMEKMIMYIMRRYKNVPMFITENGYPQESIENSSVEDLLNDYARVNYTKDYLTSMTTAMRKGANISGYFVWSLLDNFEWAYGYSFRFGLYHVNFRTQERTPKLSAKWYKEFLRGPSILQKKDSDLILQS